MRARGFTLLEIMIALGLAAVVLAAAVGIMVTTMKDAQRTRIHSSMTRDGAFVGTLMHVELKQAGLGIPTGTHIQRSQNNNPYYGTSQPTNFYSRGLIVARTDQIVVQADLPRPDAQYATFGPLDSRPTGPVPTAASADTNAVLSVLWHTENNGGCMPPTSATTACNQANTSIFFPGVATADQCILTSTTSDTGRAAKRACPWGLARVRAGEQIQIASGDGAWTHAEVEDPLTIVSYGGYAQLPSLLLNSTLSEGAAGFDQSGDNSNTWRNQQYGEGPGGIQGQGWVTTIDRVSYRYVAGTAPLYGTIRRFQCWGDPDPDHAGWPAETDYTSLTRAEAVSVTPVNDDTSLMSVTANYCTQEEIVARNVEDVSFTYYDASGAAITVDAAGEKALVRRFDYRIDFRRDWQNRAVRHTVAGSIRMPNI